MLNAKTIEFSLFSLPENLKFSGKIIVTHPILANSGLYATQNKAVHIYRLGSINQYSLKVTHLTIQPPTPWKRQIVNLTSLEKPVE